MPQLRLEYTRNLRPRIPLYQILTEIHQLLATETGIEIEHCKSRAFKLDNYGIGSGGDQKAFIHLEVGIFAGRDDTLKKKIGEQFLELIQEYFEAIDDLKLDIQFTVEFRDMEKLSYFKTSNF